MTTAHESVVYDIEDFKVWALLTDLSGAPTYSATAVDVPGISAVSLQPNLVTSELKGDSKIIAKKGRIDRFNFSATYGKIALDALPVFLGGTTVDGTGNAKWSIHGTNSLPYFKAAFRVLDTEVGDIHVVAYKCQVNGGTLLDQSSDNFGQPKIEFEGIPTHADDSLFLDILFEDVASSL